LSNLVTMVFSPVTFAPAFSGTPPFVWQWQRSGTNLVDGANITGSSSSNLTLLDPQPGDSGQYTVIVGNAYGTSTNPAGLTVVPIYSWGFSSYTPPAAATNAIAVSANSFGTSITEFAVLANGSLLGWGDDTYGSLGNMPTGSNFVFTVGDFAQELAVRQDGTANGWGQQGFYVPPNATNVVAAGALGAGVAVLRQDGNIVTWYGAGAPANATNIIAFSMGSWALGSFLAVRQDGTVLGWGDNQWGETTIPPSATNAVAVSAGYRHTLVLRADGTVVAFGTGAGTVPGGLTNVVAVAAGWDNSLVLRADGTVVGWGDYGSAPSVIANVAAIAASGNANLVLVTNNYSTAPPRILQQPMGAFARLNQTLVLEGQANGSLPLQYQWYFNGAVLGAQTNRWLLLSPLQATQSGAYQFTVANSFGTVTSTPAVVWTPPAITNPPATTVAFGSNAVLMVGAAGMGPLAYQWYYNGAPLADGGQISGSATTSLTITNFQPANLGNYTVVVTNLAGSVTSSPAVITVLNPLISTQPPSRSVFAGTITNLSVTATGQAPLTYQWLFNGTNLPDATNNPLVFSPVLTNQAGIYSVVVSNAYGMIASSNAVLTVTTLTIGTQPRSLSVLGGATTNFSVTVNGQAPFFYQWLMNGTNLPGATNNPLVLSNVLVSQSGSYAVVVTNAYGLVTSSNATLTVAALAITTQPTNRVTWPGGPAVFRVNVSGQPPFSFDWQCNGADVPGTWTNVLTLTNVLMSQFGVCDVVVSNAYGTVTSSNALLMLSQVAVWGGTSGETNLPIGLTNVTAIAAGAAGVVDCYALRSDGTAWHWPRTNIVTISNITAIAGNGGQTTAMVVRTNGIAASWYTADELILNLSGFTNIVAIAANQYANLALMSNGMVAGGFSVAGPGPPGVLTNLTNVVAVSEGSSWSMALKADGTVTAWGNNIYGQTNVPPGLTNVLAIAAGYFHGLALRSDHTVVAWGLNSFGQTTVPPGLTNVVAISGGEYHSLALLANGTVRAWGQNTYGQTNVPPGLTNVVAIAAGALHNLALVGTAPPVLTAALSVPAQGTNGFKVSVPSQSGRVYVLQYRNTLADTNWISLPLVAGNGGTLILTDPTATNVQRFYRVLQW
jgi:alpha-tubulin suppressor-like RCC1 family protein